MDTGDIYLAKSVLASPAQFKSSLRTSMWSIASSLELKSLYFCDLVVKSSKMFAAY